MMSEQKQLVENLKKEVDTLYFKLQKTQRDYDRELKQLQDGCEKTGHDFVVERVYDCHSSYNGYTCENCQKYTLMCPAKFRRE